MMMSSLVPMARACALFFVPTNRSRGVGDKLARRHSIFQDRLEFSTLRQRGEGETANRVKMRARRRDNNRFPGNVLVTTVAPLKRSPQISPQSRWWKERKTGVMDAL